ncbi:hypothetical protein Q3O98_20455 [Ralstonia pseudosolanacearum]|uniref:hypothetical protein n=1 Tax=Ralstonia pseudosolanacearum TaxID=1310165 RepID=UPI002677253A|nr:hypothetical protein [Ralstonia pseudosolanacearum]MDO3623454.1 hypothetical protein [Ralstonia pseudosolanacearum]
MIAVRPPPLETPALSLFPDLAALDRDGREAITLSQMLSMTSGLAWNEWRATSLLDNDEFGLFWRGSQVRYTFDRPMAAPAGTRRHPLRLQRRQHRRAGADSG